MIRAAARVVSTLPAARGVFVLTSLTAATLAVALTGTLAALSCAPGPARPVSIDPANDQCASCRMIVSEPRFAAQIVLPGEEPRLFDDLGCLRDSLRSGPPLPPSAVVFVADHRTKAWVPADRAVFALLPAGDTPMASRLVAHEDEASRRADPDAAGATPVSPAAILGEAR
jgi:copper chaperone NosL